MKWLLLGVALAAPVPTQPDVSILQAKCQVGCLWAGYDEGSFRAPDTCLCSDVKDFERVTRTKATRAPNTSRGVTTKRIHTSTTSD